MSIPSSRSLARLVPLALVAVAAAAVPAEEAAFEWQKRKVALKYESPRVGKHTLSELQVNSTWRLGANTPTTMTLDTALVAGEQVVAPGIYRVNLARPAQRDFALTIEGAGTWGTADSPDVSAPGAFSEAKKPNEKLEIFCRAHKTQPDAETRALELEIQFGAPVITVPVTIVGTASQPLKGFTLDAFKLPAELLEKRLKSDAATPVVSLVRKSKPKEGDAARLNILLAESQVTLLPAPTPPSDSRAAVPQPEAAKILRGAVQWADATPPAPHFTVEKAAIGDDGDLQLTVVVGARRGTISVPTAKSKS